MTCATNPTRVYSRRDLPVVIRVHRHSSLSPSFEAYVQEYFCTSAHWLQQPPPQGPQKAENHLPALPSTSELMERTRTATCESHTHTHTMREGVNPAGYILKILYEVSRNISCNLRLGFSKATMVGMIIVRTSCYVGGENCLRTMSFFCPQGLVNETRTSV